MTGAVAVDFTADDLATSGTFDAAALDLTALPPDLLPAELAATGVGAGRGRFDFRFPIVEAAPDPGENGAAAFDPCLPRRGFRVESAAGDAELADPSLILPTGGAAEFAAASGAIEVTDDVVTVRDLAVEDAGSAGRLSGGGTVGLNAPHAVRGRVRWDEWPADSLAAAAFPDWAAANPRPEDEGDGTVSGTAAADGTLVPFDLTTADGLVRVRGARLPRPGGGVLAVPAADAEFTLTPEQLRVTRLAVTAGGGTLTGSADLGRAGDRAFAADLSAEAFPLATVGDLLGDPAGFAGAVDLKIDAEGTLDPATATGSLTASGTNLRVAGIPVGTFEAAGEADGETVVVRRLAATVGGASVGGAGRVRLTGDRPFAAAVNLTGVTPGRLAADLAGRLPPDAAEALARVRGTLAAAVTAEGELNTGRARVTAAITAPRLAVVVPPVRDEPGLEPGELELDNAAVDLVLTRAPDGEVDLKVERLTGGVAGGSVRATATVPLVPPERSATDDPAAADDAREGGKADVIAEDVDLSALLNAAFPAGLSDGGPAPVSGTADLAAAAAWPAGVPSFGTVSANARLTSDALAVARAPAGGGKGVAGTTAKAVTVDARLAGGVGRVDAKADALGGSVSAAVGITRRGAGPTGRVRTGPASSDEGFAAFGDWPVRAAGTAKLTNVNLTQLERLAGAAGDVRLARLADRAGISGELDADVAFDSHPVAAVSRTGRASSEVPAANHRPGAGRPAAGRRPVADGSRRGDLPAPGRRGLAGRPADRAVRRRDVHRRSLWPARRRRGVLAGGRAGPPDAAGRGRQGRRRPDPLAAGQRDRPAVAVGGRGARADVAALRAGVAAGRDVPEFLRHRPLAAAHDPHLRPHDRGRRGDPHRGRRRAGRRDGGGDREDLLRPRPRRGGRRGRGPRRAGRRPAARGGRRRGRQRPAERPAGACRAGG